MSVQICQGCIEDFWNVIFILVGTPIVTGCKLSKEYTSSSINELKKNLLKPALIMMRKNLETLSVQKHLKP